MKNRREGEKEGKCVQEEEEGKKDYIVRFQMFVSTFVYLFICQFIYLLIGLFIHNIST